MNRTLLFAVLVMLLSRCASHASAQAPQLRPVDLKGTVEATAQGVIHIQCDGQEIYLKIDPRTTKIECKGTAEASYLEPGLLVRFRGDFDKKGIAKEDIKELSIVSPSEKNEPGVTSDDIADEDDKRKSKKDGGVMLIVGTIKQFKDGQLVVQAGGRAVRAKLAKDADLTVDVDDYTMAEAGDKIQFKGRMPQPTLQPMNTPSQAIADEITITFAEPLAGDAPKKPKGKSGKAAKGGKASAKKK
jgi:hypothetical protein